MTNATLTVRLFGSLGVWIGGERVLGLHRREGERLLAYLLLHEGEPVSYRTLADLFWPSEAAPGNGDYGTFPSTRQAVHFLRTALGEHAYRLKSVGRGLILLDMRGATVDLLEFDRIVRQNHRETLGQAASLHTSPLLEEWDEAWVNEARSVRLRSYKRICEVIQQEPTIDLLRDSQAVVETRTPPRTYTPLTGETLHDPLGGAVPLDSPYYVERSADSRFIDAVTSRTSTVLVKADARMGKSSLVARGLHQARSSGATVALTDFQALNAEQMEDSAALFLAMAVDLALQVNIDFDPAKHWSPYFGPGTNLEQFVRRHVLSASEKPLVWGMDEVDRLFKYPYSGELFGLMRSWHNRRAMDPTGPWMRLTLVLAYATETAMFIADQSQSPFNIGTQVTLTDFTLEEQEELDRRYDNPLTGPSEHQQLFNLLHGHPFLTRRALQEIATGRYSLAALIEKADSEDGPFGHDLHKLTSSLLSDDDLVACLRRIIAGETCSDRFSFHRLRSGGFVKGEWNKSEQLRCPLYAVYLHRILLSE